MKTADLDSYVDTIRRSGLVEPARLKHVVREFQSDPTTVADDIETFAQRLIRLDLITAWQHRLLAKGLYRGFFLGRYKLLCELGSGGMSTVYLAEHLLLRRKVAIKVLHPRRVSNPVQLERFYRESHANSLLDHHNVVRVFDFDADGKFHYLVLEYVDGATLQEVVSHQGKLSVETAAAYLYQSANGLAHIHDSGLVHRDLKPANLLVGPNGVIKVSDLGLALAHESESISLTLEEGMIIGTVDYLAPEQAVDSHQVSSAADIYSLGCSFYFMLTGQAPFGEGTTAVRLMKHQIETPKPITEFRSDVPYELLNLLDNMTAKSADDRPSAKRVTEVIQHWLVSRRHQGFMPPCQTLPPLQSSLDSHHGESVLNAPSTVVQRNQGDTHVEQPKPEIVKGKDFDQPGSARHDKVKFHCSSCNVLLFAPVAALGRKVRCPKCDAYTDLPSRDTWEEPSSLPELNLCVPED